MVKGCALKLSHPSVRPGFRNSCPLALLRHSLLRLLNLYRFKLAYLKTGPALDAFSLIQEVGLLFFACNCLCRTNFKAGATTRAGLGIDAEGDEILTRLGRASLLLDMGLVFISKIADGGKHGIRG